MSKRKRRKYTRNEKIFYILSLLLILSLVLSVTPLLFSGPSF